MVYKFILGAVCVCLVVAQAHANTTTFIEYDWNDGTTQGWSDSNDPPINENDKLRFGSEGNGSTQIFGPLWIPGENWSGLQSISFDLEINDYSGISSPSDMTVARFNVSSVNDFFGPDFAVAGLTWTLDISNWSFDEARTFELSIDDAVFLPSAYITTVDELLSDVTFVDIFLRGVNSNTQTSSGLLDNFVAVSAVPIPAAVWLFGSGLIGLICIAKRKKA